MRRYLAGCSAPALSASDDSLAGSAGDLCEGVRRTQIIRCGQARLGLPPRIATLLLLDGGGFAGDSMLVGLLMLVVVLSVVVVEVGGWGREAQGGYAVVGGCAELQLGDGEERGVILLLHRPVLLLAVAV